MNGAGNVSTQEMESTRTTNTERKPPVTHPFLKTPITGGVGNVRAVYKFTEVTEERTCQQRNQLFSQVGSNLVCPAWKQLLNRSPVRVNKFQCI